MKKISICIVSAALIVAGSVVLHGCEQSSLFDNTHEVFLDLNISAMSQRDLTEAEQGILLKGHERIVANSVFEDGQFRLTVTNGAAVGMSERLFNFYKESIVGMNEQIKEQGITLIEIEQGVFKDINDIEIMNSPRLRNGVEQGNCQAGRVWVSTMWFPGVIMTEWHFCDNAAGDFFHSAQLLKGSLSFGFSLAGLWGLPAATGLFLETLNWTLIANDYRRSGGNGMILVQTTFTNTMPPRTFYMVQF